MLWLTIFSTLAAAAFGYWLRGRGEAGQRARQEDLERRVAERTEELARFKRFAEATADFFGMAGMDHQMTYLNPAARSFLGLPLSGPLDGVKLEHCYTPEGYRLLCEVVIPAAVRDGSWTGEVMMRRHDGAEIPCLLAGAVVCDEQNQPTHMVGILRDISERKRLEAELRLFAVIADATTDFWGIAGMDEQSIYLNAAARRVMGQPPSGPLDGVMVEQLFTPESYRIIKETSIPTALRDGTWTGELKVRRHDGSEIPVSTAGLIIRDENGQPSYMVATMRDISERKQLEAELGRFAVIADATTDFWGIAGMDEQSIYLNAAARRVMGQPPSGPLDGVMVEQLFTPESYRIIKETSIPSALRDGTWTGELKMRVHDGSEIPVSMAGLIIRDENGQPSYMAGVMRDISDRKQLEAELQRGLAREKELSDLKSSFVSMVSHEFRTPLGVIGSSAQILDRYFARLDEDERREHLDNITTSVKRMARMMEDVLVLSRVDSGRMEFRPTPLALGELCRRLLDELRSAHGGNVHLRIESAAEAPAEADENLLRHILTNLLTNAHKYSPPDAPVHLALARENGDAVFTVRDEGIGIPEEDQAHLFEAFHRGGNVGQVGGTGLGLVIVRRCCELHSGSVSGASREGGGTTFTVRLPVFKTT